MGGSIQQRGCFFGAAYTAVQWRGEGVKATGRRTAAWEQRQKGASGRRTSVPIAYERCGAESVLDYLCGSVTIISDLKIEPYCWVMSMSQQLCTAHVAFSVKVCWTVQSAALRPLSS